MASLSSLYRLIYSDRLKAIDSYATHYNELQNLQLREITRRLSRTVYGQAAGITDRCGYTAFSRQLPIVRYEEIASEVERMLRGESRILCAERTEWYAKSSGTTNDKSKYIPVPTTHLERCHYRGGKDVMALYLRNHPDSDILKYKHFALSGSLDKQDTRRYIHTGDLSAILLSRFPVWARSLRVPPLEVALLPEWGEKLDRTSNALLQSDLATLSGVPSWTMVIVKEVLRKSGARTAREVWPHLEVFFHGGIAFGPYRSEFERILGDGVRYMETYNASEGFFGIQDDPADPAMLLMLDYGVFYEFIPMDIWDEASPHGAIPLREVQTGVNYAMVISTLGGLYRYLIGDTVMFTSTAPYKFVITGRTKSFINAFGEELMVGNTDAALLYAAQQCGAQLREYTACPVFLTHEGKGYHHYAVEWEQEPTDLSLFTFLLDTRLKELNSDYEAKRHLDISLQLPHITTVRPGTFLAWMEEKGKLGGQHKVPRLTKDDQIVSRLLALSAQR